MVVAAGGDGRRPRYALGIAVAVLLVAAYALTTSKPAAPAPSATAPLAAAPSATPTRSVVGVIPSPPMPAVARS
jgi:hypothetical protein